MNAAWSLVSLSCWRRPMLLLMAVGGGIGIQARIRKPPQMAQQNRLETEQHGIVTPRVQATRELDEPEIES